jgi:membrane-bound lytic murein transglycosylase B
MAAFRSKAIARGVTADTYTHVMEGLRPDTTGLEAIRNQPEFTQKLWQYLFQRKPEIRRPTAIRE